MLQPCGIPFVYTSASDFWFSWPVTLCLSLFLSFLFSLCYATIPRNCLNSVATYFTMVRGQTSLPFFCLYLFQGASLFPYCNDFIKLVHNNSIFLKMTFHFYHYYKVFLCANIHMLLFIKFSLSLSHTHTLSFYLSLPVHTQCLQGDTCRHENAYAKLTYTYTHVYMYLNVHACVNTCM